MTSDHLPVPTERFNLQSLQVHDTGRLWQKMKPMEGKLPRSSRTIGCTDCLDPASSYTSFVARFRYWNVNAKEGRLKALEQGQVHAPTGFDAYMAAVAGAVNTCLAPSGWRDIGYPFSANTQVAQHPDHGQLPVELLSHGIRNMMGREADMAFRAVKLNPQLARLQRSMARQRALGQAG